jgi:hypothetical protein
MNRSIFLGVWMLLFSAVALAQGPDNPGDRKEKVEAAKIAFITRELNLTPQEAQTFWPVYNQFQDEMKAINKKRATELLDDKLNFDSMSDAELAKAIDNEFYYQQQELDLKKKYNEQFKKVLPVRKVAKYWVAEQKFKLFLLKQLREQQQGGGRMNGPGNGR